MRERRNLPSIPDRPITFASHAEYAAGILLERYLAEFQLKMGTTFQVPIGHDKTCDFYVNGVFVEYHPCNLNYEFDDRQALRRFWESLKHVKQPFRDHIIESISDELSEKYYRRRKFLITMHGGKDSELIVCRNPTDFYRNVIKRFGANPPREATFLQEFQNLANQRF
jgi:hypothetical protein